MQKQKRTESNGHTEGAVVAPESSGGLATKIIIPKLETAVLTVTIEGETPLVVHAFDAKSQQQMLDKQMGVAKNKKEKKDPVACFLGGLYPMGGKAKAEKRRDGTYAIGRFGFPAGGVKKAMVAAARQLDGLKMTFLRGAFHVVGEGENNLVEIIGEARMRQDTVRLQTGVADIRFRPAFDPWSMKLMIQFNTSVITPPQIAHLLNTAGFAVGLGENRPDRGGDWGRFRVASSKETLISNPKAKA